MIAANGLTGCVRVGSGCRAGLDNMHIHTFDHCHPLFAPRKYGTPPRAGTSVPSQLTYISLKLERDLPAPAENNKKNTTMNRPSIAVRNAVAGPSRRPFPSPRQRCLVPPRAAPQRQRRSLVTSLFPQPPMDHRRSASTSTSQTDWLSWLRKAAAIPVGDAAASRKALLFAGLVSVVYARLCTKSRHGAGRCRKGLCGAAG